MSEISENFGTAFDSREDSAVRRKSSLPIENRLGRIGFHLTDPTCQMMADCRAQQSPVYNPEGILSYATAHVPAAGEKRGGLTSSRPRYST